MSRKLNACFSRLVQWATGVNPLIVPEILTFTIQLEKATIGMVHPVPTTPHQDYDFILDTIYDSLQREGDNSSVWLCKDFFIKLDRLGDKILISFVYGEDPIKSTICFSRSSRKGELSSWYLTTLSDNCEHLLPLQSSLGLADFVLEIAPFELRAQAMAGLGKLIINQKLKEQTSKTASKESDDTVKPINPTIAVNLFHASVCRTIEQCSKALRTALAAYAEAVIDEMLSCDKYPGLRDELAAAFAISHEIQEIETLDTETCHIFTEKLKAIHIRHTGDMKQ